VAIAKLQKEITWAMEELMEHMPKASKGTTRCIGNGQLLPSCLSKANLFRIGRRGCRDGGFEVWKLFLKPILGICNFVDVECFELASSSSYPCS